MSGIRIRQARVEFAGGLDPAVARAATTRALVTLAAAEVPARGHRDVLRVEVRVRPTGEGPMAEAIAAAVADALRPTVGG